MAQGEHHFGGDWTEEKLDRVENYLTAYCTVMKKQNFELLYVDAFAGSGKRLAANGDDDDETEKKFKLEGQERFREGSAKRALKLPSPFHRYVFIERDPTWAASLLSLKNEFPHLSDSIEVVNGDSNVHLQELCSANWNNRRAVLFLDPYGMQVDWSTMKAIAATKAIDAWILFPLSGVNRLLVKTKGIPEAWQHRLDRFFGSSEWRDRFYEPDTQIDLFGLEKERKVADFSDIERYYVKRLRTLFPGVARNPRRLSNTRNSPLFSLCFVCSNPSRKACETALRIAEHILGEKR
jgi:three-Cys-motif partner protein